MLLLTNVISAVSEPISLPVPWPEHNQMVSPTIEKLDYVSHLAGLDRSPAIRMLEQTIVCLHELDRLGSLTISQKIELSDLIARHRSILRQHKLEPLASARAATSAGVAAS